MATHRSHHLLLFLLFLVFSAAAAAYAASPDSLPLLHFKSLVSSDPLDRLQSWSPLSDPCTSSWYGITCSSTSSSSAAAPPRVTSLQLPAASLVGILSLPSLLQSLDMLSFLDLSHNHFSSSLQQPFPRCPPSFFHLNLSSNNLTGPLPPDLFFQCSRSLRTLDLSSNSLSGDLPPDALAGNLSILHLSGNRLNGSIPDAAFSGERACSDLQSLDLSSNAFSGRIPVAFQRCSALRYLNLSNNHLAGRIPASLFPGLSAIESLDFSRNALVGPIPPDLAASCATLTELDLSVNNLSGVFPPSMRSCASLRLLNLGTNNLSGDFPAGAVGGMSSLEVLLLPFNRFAGPLPEQIGEWRRLKVLDISSNELSGPIPPAICGLPPPSSAGSSLEQLTLAGNDISGEIPPSIANCSRLRSLGLSYNRLRGAIPPELGRLSALESLSMWKNELSEAIPAELGRLPRLRILVLNDNFLSGPIPGEIANATSLEWISLSDNRLSGEIPPSMGNMQKLTLLELGNNSLSGRIPAELANGSMFVWLDLHGNYLTGEIPAGIGRHPGGAAAPRVSGAVFAFVRNRLLEGCRGMGTLLEFAGVSPAALASAPFMNACNLSRLYLGGVLNLDPDLTSIQYLDLSYNFLDGGIPAEMGNRTALVMLSLAHNQLSGSIPATFRRLTALGVLDLSHNLLDGSISPLAACTFLVDLDVSVNNFSGAIPAGQLAALPAAVFAGNPLLCGDPLQACGARSSAAGDAAGSSRRRRHPPLPWANSAVLGVFAAVALAGMLLVWGFMARAKGKYDREGGVELALSPTVDGWSVGGGGSDKDPPLSINVAMFERPLRKLTFAQLIEATNGFSGDSLIGMGGFGEVYRAVLPDGTVVAIKKLLHFSYQGDREFTAEMETLGKIKHRNLVPLLGYCKVGEERLLVYEYMHGGSVDDALHGGGGGGGDAGLRRRKLSWEQRKRIALGAARGLSFLHHNCIPHIIHRDMKSSNVLLDAGLEARVSDFGMARLISALDTHLSVSTLAGTPGYVPPEYYQSFRCTTKGDVYSFGVVLLELLTGKRPTDKEFFEDANLVSWVRQLMEEGRELEAVDPTLRGGGDGEGEEAAAAAAAAEEEEEAADMRRCLKIACDCVQDQPSRRPSMAEVVAMLKELQTQDGGSLP